MPKTWMAMSKTWIRPLRTAQKIDNGLEKIQKIRVPNIS